MFEANFTGRQIGISVVAALVIVVFHIQRGQLAVINAQCATAIVYILSVQAVTRALGCTRFAQLYQSLESV